MHTVYKHIFQKGSLFMGSCIRKYKLFVLLRHFLLISVIIAARSCLISIIFKCTSVHLSMYHPLCLEGDGNGILTEVWLKGHFLLGDHQTVSLFFCLRLFRASETLVLGTEGPDSKLMQSKLIKLGLLYKNRKWA